MAEMEVLLDRKIARDLKTLARFIQLYCNDVHRDRARDVVTMKTHDVRQLAGRDIILCEECAKLLKHGFTKRTHCTMDPKPTCKNCPKHCYAPSYREQIRQVMRHSGNKMLYRGRLDYLFHILF